MGRTIIQPIGPLYGEAVNGTVFGRPNGSVYVPANNTIALDLEALYVRNVADWENNIAICTSTGTTKHATYSAQSQDIASYVQIQISDANTFLTYAYRSFSAGLFNTDVSVVAWTDKDSVTITEGSTHYIRAVLFSSTGVEIAVSDVIEITGWVAE